MSILASTRRRRLDWRNSRSVRWLLNVSTMKAIDHRAQCHDAGLQRGAHAPSDVPGRANGGSSATASQSSAQRLQHADRSCAPGRRPGHHRRHRATPRWPPSAASTSTRALSPSSRGASMAASSSVTSSARSVRTLPGRTMRAWKRRSPSRHSNGQGTNTSCSSGWAVHGGRRAGSMAAAPTAFSHSAPIHHWKPR